jgi:hypothetical protein
LNAGSTRPEAASFSLALQPFGKPALFSAKCIIHRTGSRPRDAGRNPRQQALPPFIFPDDHHLVDIFARAANGIKGHSSTRLTLALAEIWIE